MSAFGAVLRELREVQGMSQSELGRRIGMGSGYISRLESGQREPSREFVEAVVVALGLDRGQARRLRLAAGWATPEDVYAALTCPHCGAAVELVKGAA